MKWFSVFCSWSMRTKERERERKKECMCTCDAMRLQINEINELRVIFFYETRWFYIEFIFPVHFFSALFFICFAPTLMLRRFLVSFSNSSTLNWRKCVQDRRWKSFICSMRSISITQFDVYIFTFSSFFISFFWGLLEAIKYGKRCTTHSTHLIVLCVWSCFGVEQHRLRCETQWIVLMKLN